LSEVQARQEKIEKAQRFTQGTKESVKKSSARQSFIQRLHCSPGSDVAHLESMMINQTGKNYLTLSAFARESQGISQVASKIILDQ